MSKPKMPSGLGARSKRLWAEMVDSGMFVFRPDEILLLEDACREIDLIDRMERTVKRDKLLVPGSMGQDTAHPLVGQLAQHRNTLARILKQLDLPDEEGGAVRPGVEDRSSKARSAAEARWRGRGA